MAQRGEHRVSIVRRWRPAISCGRRRPTFRRAIVLSEREIPVSTFSRVDNNRRHLPLNSAPSGAEDRVSTREQRVDHESARTTESHHDLLSSHDDPGA